jgi:hypothetical protein
MITSRNVVRLSAFRDGAFVTSAPPPYSRPVPTMMLTKRRAVDHCRVHSSLCRPS